MSADKAFSIMKAGGQEGAGDTVDTVQGRVKQTCNRCGLYCCHVGIIDRRTMPQDVLMAVYRIGETAAERQYVSILGPCEIH